LPIKSCPPTSLSLQNFCQFFGQHGAKESLTDILASQWLAKIGKAQNGMNETHHKSKSKHLNYWSRKFD
jgi:hypothetical protein